MKKAFAEAGAWFFATIWICMLLAVWLNDKEIESMSLAAVVGEAAIVAGLLAGFVFFSQWYAHEKREQKFKDAQRRKELDLNDEKDTKR